MQDAFEFLNGWADRVLVISLARAVERRARLPGRLRGLEYELFAGTDRLDLDREALARGGVLDESRARRAFRHRRDMYLGEIGCALSHRRVYEEAVRNGWERTVVLEDDVVPRAEELALLPRALSQLPPGWDLCYLGYALNEAPTARDRAKRAFYLAAAPLGLCRWRLPEVRRLHPRPFSGNLRRAGRHDWALAYAVSREGARKLLEAQTPVAYRADSLLTMMVLTGRLEAFVTEPRMFDQEDVATAPSFTQDR